MANENLGTIPWHCHKNSHTAFIRKDRRDKLYIYCDECGIFGAKGRSFQEHINEHAIMYGTSNAEFNGGGEPVEVNENPEALEERQEEKPRRNSENFTPAPKAIPKSEPKKVSSLLSGLMNVLGDEGD